MLFDEEEMAILDSCFPPSPRRPDGDGGTTTANVQVSGGGNNNCATTDVPNHTSVNVFPGFDVPLITGTEGTSSTVQASAGNGNENGAAADVANNSSCYDDIDISAILAGFDYSPLATGDEGKTSNVVQAPANNFVWDDDIDVSAILAGLEPTATVHVSAGNDASAVNPTDVLLPSTSTGNGNNVGVATDEPVDAQAGNNMLLVTRETNVSAGGCGLTERTMELGSGFGAPIMLDAESIRPADVCDNKPEDDIMSLPEGFSPSFLAESPIFLPDSLVPPPSPTTGKFSSGNDHNINFVSAITDQSKNKGKEIVIEQGCSSFANNHGAAASVQQNMGGMHHQILPHDHAAFTVAMMNTVNVLSSVVHQYPPLYNNHGTTGISFPSLSNSFFQQHSNFYPQANNNISTFFGPANNNISTFFGPANNNRASGGVTVASTEPIANRVGGGVLTVASSSERILNPVPLEEDKGRMAPKNGKYISRDGYNWRKYGQKPLRGGDYPRAYYKCTHQGCRVKKQVEWESDGHVTEIIYKGAHTHPKPVPPNRGPPPPPEPEPENQATSSASFSNEEGGELDPAAESDASGSKRRRFESHAAVPLATGARRSGKQQRYIFQTASDVDIMEDGYRWRKYGQKIVKGNPNPRSYYKCTTPGCEVRKHVERATENRIMVISTYEGNHTHEAPIPRKNNPGAQNPPAPASSRLPEQRPGPPPIPPTARPSQGGSAGRGLLGRPRVHGSLPSDLIMSKSIGNANNVTANNQSSGGQLGQTSGDATGTTMPKPGPVTASGGLSTAPSGGSNPNTSASGGSFATFYGSSTGGGSFATFYGSSTGGGSFATFYGSSTGGGSFATFYGGRSSSASGGSSTRFCGGLSSSAARGRSNTMFYGGSNSTPATNNASTSYGRLNTAPNGGGVGGWQFNARGVNTTAPTGGGVGSSSISQQFNGVLNNNNVANGVSNNNTGNGVLSATAGNVHSGTGNGGGLNTTANGGSNTASSSIYDRLFIAAGINPTSNGGLYTASNGGGSSVYQQVNGGLYGPSNGGGLNATTSYGGFNGGGLNTTGNGGLNNNRANGGFNSAAANGRPMAPANGGNGGGLNNNGVSVGLSATADGGFNSASANGGLNAPSANGRLNTTAGNGGLNNNNGATGGFNTNTAYGGLNAPSANGGLNSTENGGLNNINGATGGFNTNTAYCGPNAPANTAGNGGLNNNGANGGFNSSTAYGGLNASPVNGGLNSGLNAHANGGAGGGAHNGSSSSMYHQFPGSLPPPQI